MFTKIKKKDVRANMISLLEFIVVATQGTAGYAIAPDVNVQALQKAEPTFVEVNSTVAIDALGNVQVRALTAGIEALAKHKAAVVGAETAAANVGEAATYEIESDIPVPASKRGGLKGETYPFEKLNPGQSFFVKATETRPNPAKSLASTVSSATKRFKGKDGRKFTIRAVEGGARVWRLAETPAAPPSPSPAA